MLDKKIFKKLGLEVLVIILFIFVLNLVSYNYLFFHVVVELFSVVIMCILFAVTLNAYKYIDNRYLIFVGISGFFIGSLDLLHTISFDGMNIIKTTSFYANQFWVATRFFESTILLVGFIYVSKKITINVTYLIAAYAVITASIILSILYFKIFPTCYIRGVGQTSFKIISEYVIISILSLSLIMLVRNKKYFEAETYVLILISIALTILSEFCFTLYVANYDFVNKLGHIFKVLAFFMIYKANIDNGFKKPIVTFFRELKASEQKNKEYSIELEKQVLTRNKFFSIISHDLKNPFNILMGYSELLLKKHSEYDTATREKFIKTIYESAEQTYNLLENLLAWARTQDNKIPYEPTVFDISEVLDKSILLLSKNAEIKEINIEKAYSNLYVYADIEMIKTVVRNLLTNALKFTSKGGTMRVESKIADEMIVTNIIDTGIGISEDKIHSLFRIDKAFSSKGTENESGTGLGLILCHEFILKNNGKIWVESELGKGSKFSFSLKKESAQ